MAISIPYNPTIKELTKRYKDYIQAQVPTINAYAPNTFWSIDAGAMSAMLLDLYMNLQIVQNSIYPQYSVGDQVDEWLYSCGLPPRIGATYGTVQCIIPTGTYPITIPINATFTVNGIGITYQSLQAITVTSSTTSFTLYATSIGVQQLPSVGASLTYNSVTAQTTSVIAGANEESDQSCINRILQSNLIPEAGARQSDYYDFCFLADSSVTEAIIIPSFFTLTNVKVLGVIPLVGPNSMTDFLLDQSFITFVPYSRDATPAVTLNVDTYIQSQKLVGLTPIIGECITYTIDSTLTTPFIATVSLAPGYELSSNVTIISQTSDGTANTQIYTITQLVQREIRRAICNQPFGATVIGTLNYITIESLITAVVNQLGAIDGALAQLITNITFNVTDILVPTLTASAPNKKTNAIYDVPSYAYIQVISI